MLIKLALASLKDRKSSVILSLMAMAVSIFVLLGVEHVRHQAKESFSNTISGTDLIVGARTGRLNLLLYSVFRIGNPTNNISWQSFQTIKSDSKVKWAIPLSLGDSHKGFRVLGTTQDYFQYFSYGKQRSLHFEKGEAFHDIFNVVLGSKVADDLGYKLGDKIILAHGIAKTSFSLHQDKPFIVTGILATTGTPVDQTLHVSLQGLEAIHTDWQGTQASTQHTGNTFESERLQPQSITAIMLGLESKITTFKVQRNINQYKQEALLAIMPGVALSELWQMMAILEDALFLISILVFVSACLGISAMLLSSIRERKKEIALLRVIGASPIFLFLLIELEVLLILVASIILGSGVLAGSLLLSQNYIESTFGLYIGINVFSASSLYFIALILSASIIISVTPFLIGHKKLQVKSL